MPFQEHTANSANYLNHAGLVKLIELIKGADAADKLALEKAIGIKNADGAAVALTVGTTTYNDMKSYADALVAGLDSDNDARLKALEATHAKVGGEGTDKDNFQTVAQEVNTAVTKLLNGAPEKFDTLKEIADWIANSTDQSAADAEALVVTVDRLDGAVDIPGSVKQQIKAAVDALDTPAGGVSSAAVVQGTAAEGEAAAVASTQHVSVNVVETDGIITGVTVTEADIASKVVLNEEIARAKAAEAANAQAISDEADRVDGIIGELPESFGEGEDAVEIETVVDYIEAVAAANTATVDGLNATERSKMAEDNTVTAADKVGIKVVQTKGLITGVSVVTNDIASAALLGDADDTKDDATAFGAIAKEAAARAAAIEALDAEISSADGGEITVKVTEVDGKITTVNVTKIESCGAEEVADLWAAQA